MRLSKADLTYYATRRLGATEHAGYFTEAGELRIGPYYSARIGTRPVAYPYGTYISEAGVYVLESDALEGARLFRAKMRELLAAGEYDD